MRDILQQNDDRLLVVVGPAQINDPQAAMEYAARLRGMIQHHSKELLIIMRTHFQEPKATVGWKGMVRSSPRHCCLLSPQGGLRSTTRT